MSGNFPFGEGITGFHFPVRPSRRFSYARSASGALRGPRSPDGEEMCLMQPGSSSIWMDCRSPQVGSNLRGSSKSVLVACQSHKLLMHDEPEFLRVRQFIRAIC